MRNTLCWIAYKFDSLCEVNTIFWYHVGKHVRHLPICCDARSDFQPGESWKMPQCESRWNIKLSKHTDSPAITSSCIWGIWHQSCYQNTNHCQEIWYLKVTMGGNSRPTGEYFTQKLHLFIILQKCHVFCRVIKKSPSLTQALNVSQS